jgi:molybdenum cofactor guanylyltransferase
MLNHATPAPHLSAIVLAGGQSSRMGRDKALIEIAGVPMLRRICTAALHCTSIVYVVARDDRYQSLLPPGCQLIIEAPAEPAHPSAGPLVGFAQGVTAITTDWVLLLACDLPRLSGEILQQWSRQLAQVPPAAVALLPRSPQGWEPLCGFYRRASLTSLTEFGAGGGRSFQVWLAGQTVATLIVDDRLLFNCNTPSDLNQI